MRLGESFRGALNTIIMRGMVFSITGCPWPTSRTVCTATVLLVSIECALYME